MVTSSVGDVQSEKEVENFCKRFSFGMYDQENIDGAPCIDPREESSIIKGVERHETQYNQNVQNYGQEKYDDKKN